MTTPVLLPPKMDFVFKRIFGNEKHPNILISFLNAVLTSKGSDSISTIKRYNHRENYLEDKYSRLDVKATTIRGSILILKFSLKMNIT